MTSKSLRVQVGEYYLFSAVAAGFDVCLLYHVTAIDGRLVSYKAVAPGGPVVHHSWDSKYVPTPNMTKLSQDQGEALWQTFQKAK